MAPRTAGPGCLDRSRFDPWLVEGAKEINAASPLGFSPDCAKGMMALLQLLVTGLLASTPAPPARPVADTNPRAVIAAAVRAVESNTVESGAAAWRARLARDSGDV